MAEYHVGCGLTAIYAGTINKDKTLWKSRTDCTEEAIEAVRDYLVRECLGGFDCKKKTTGGYTWVWLMAESLSSGSQYGTRNKSWAANEGPTKQ